MVLLNNQRKGFTLLELLVIIGIISVIVIIAGWQYKRTLASQTLTNEAIRVQNIIQDQRYRSIEQGRRRGVMFRAPDTIITFVVNPDLTVSYEVIETLGKDFVFGNGGANAPLPIVGIVPDADGIMFTGNRCVFNPTGMALSAGALTFTGSFGTVGIIVSPTGQIKAYKWVNGQWSGVR